MKLLVSIVWFTEGRLGFKQEKLIEYFFLLRHNETHKGSKVQRIVHCNPNDQEAREDFLIFRLDTLNPKGLKQKCALKY